MQANEVNPRVAVIGYGRFGQAFAELAARAGCAVRAFDPAAAVPLGLRADSIPEAIAEAHYVVLAVPLEALRAVAAQLGECARSDQVVIDVASVKSEPMALLHRELGEGIPWVATHPLFGPRSLAFSGASPQVVVCPNPQHPHAVEEVCALYQRLGCRVQLESAEVHDQRMAATHGLVFFLGKALAEAGFAREMPCSPPSFELLRQVSSAVASEAPHVEEAVQRKNPYSAEVRRRLLAALTALDFQLSEGSPSPMAPSEGKTTSSLVEALEGRRSHIDQLDHQLLVLLARRFVISREVGGIKSALGQAVQDVPREGVARAERRRWAEGLGLSTAFVDELLELIFSHSRKLQEQERSA